MKKNLSTTASVSVRVPIRDILRRYATAAVMVVTAVAVGVGVGWGCSGDGVGIGTAITAEKRNESGGGGGGGGVRKGKFTDNRDNNEYDSVRIGNQTWMAQNLNYDTSGSWCYGDNPSNCNIYGRLYEWNTAMGGASSSSASQSGVKGVCPFGWHLPSRAEWNQLESYVGSSAGRKLKSTDRWNSGGNGTDIYGFSALPGGGRFYSVGSFLNAGYDGNWWTATEYGSGYAYYRDMNYNNVHLGEYGNSKEGGFAVRCVGD